MTEKEKREMIATSWELHAKVEAAYLAHPAKMGEADWLDKQRLLMADMALHLLQTAVYPDEIRLDKLRNNMNAILTIGDRFLPEAELIKATDKLFE
ncbi:hypothetical protein [Neptunitalea lumnitzerae]|uniref:Uncharacterized protein n=1 Tax=Neptunitalea lumnitzerae TaxID=2965509 RepID=A0ABQ5MM00_9FLAO|nr:hypothetical protein [Neptunitalea sp. Y10]GLB50336.1 hypothetical protein Y10_27040 [Neptunitalea sp. Y10]